MTMVFLKFTVLPCPLRQPPVVEYLQHHVENVRMSFLNLVKQHYAVRPAPDGFGQLPAFLITDISRRRSDQPADGVLS
jgi:hypothetical protein